MAAKGTLKNKIANRIKRKAGSVFLRKDFADLGGYDQVGRALRQLVQSQFLLNIGYGLYARTRTSTVTGNIVPNEPLPELAEEALLRLGVNVLPSEAERLYNEGKSTQVPTGRAICVQGRISRKIGYNGKYIYLEQQA